VKSLCVFQTLAATSMDDQELTESMQKLLIVMQRLDEKIAPMLEADGELFNKRLDSVNFWTRNLESLFSQHIKSSIYCRPHTTSGMYVCMSGYTKYLFDLDVV